MTATPQQEQIAPLAQQRSQSFSQQQRVLLCDGLTRNNMPAWKAYRKAVAQNLSRLRLKNTLTLTTGHQLNLSLGPLYLTYKILTVLTTAKYLAAQYPQYHFVPIYYMLSEDHDVEEIASCSLFRKTYTWQTEQKGAVGAFSTKGLAALFEKMPFFLSPFQPCLCGCFHPFGRCATLYE